MDYSHSLLKTKAECDALLKKAKGIKKDLELKKLQLESSLEDYTENSSDLAGNLQAAQLDVDTQTALVAGLPEGKKKEKEKIELQKAQLRLTLLNDRKNKNGSPEQLERELELAFTIEKLVVVDGFITGVTAHKATL
jgi:hypothetical protein